jgi:hypothetical protein
VPHLNLAVNNEGKKGEKINMLVTRQTRNNVETIFCNPAIVVIFFCISTCHKGVEGGKEIWVCGGKEEKVNFFFVDNCVKS